MSELSRILSFPALGAGLIISLLFLLSNSASPLIEPFERNATSLVLVASLIAGFCAMSIALLLKPELIARVMLCSITASLVGALVFVVALLPVLAESIPLTAGAGFLLGAALTVNLHFWAYCYSRLEQKTALLTLTLSLLLASLAWLILDASGSAEVSLLCSGLFFILQVPLLLMTERQVSKRKSGACSLEQGIDSSLKWRAIACLALVYWLNMSTFWPLSGELASRDLINDTVAYLLIVLVAVVICWLLRLLPVTKLSKRLAIIMGAAFPLGLVLLFSSVLLDAFLYLNGYTGFASNPRLGTNLMIAASFATVVLVPSSSSTSFGQQVKSGQATAADPAAGMPKARFVSIALLCSAVAAALGLVLSLQLGDKNKTFTLIAMVALLALTLFFWIVDITHALRQMSSATELPALESDTLEQFVLAQAESYSLSVREGEILLGLLRGRTTSLIARDLFISSETVRTHIKRIYSKTGVHSRDELVQLMDFGRPE